MVVTAYQNRFGHIHLFEGVGEVSTTPTNATIDGKESDVYFQSQEDITTFEDMLSEEDKHNLNNGYVISCNVSGAEGWFE